MLVLGLEKSIVLFEVGDVKVCNGPLASCFLCTVICKLRLVVRVCDIFW
jgi:hypothetical protein